MEKNVNILLLTFCFWQVVFYLFGNPDSMIWSSIFYIIESAFVLYLLWFISDLTIIKKWIVVLIGFTYIVRIVVHGIGLVNNSVFEFLNKDFTIGLLISAGVGLWIISNRKK